MYIIYIYICIYIYIYLYIYVCIYIYIYTYITWKSPAVCCYSVSLCFWHSWTCHNVHNYLYIHIIHIHIYRHVYIIHMNICTNIYISYIRVQTYTNLYITTSPAACCSLDSPCFLHSESGHKKAPFSTDNFLSNAKSGGHLVCVYISVCVCAERHMSVCVHIRLFAQTRMHTHTHTHAQLSTENKKQRLEGTWYDK